MLYEGHPYERDISAKKARHLGIDPKIADCEFIIASWCGKCERIVSGEQPDKQVVSYICGIMNLLCGPALRDRVTIK